VIAKIPEDVMTLVAEKESGNTKVKSLDDRRVYEVIGGGTGETRSTDFEGRVVVRTAKSLKITGGPAARMTVRWRFGTVTDVKVNGVAVQAQMGADGPSVELDYAATSVVEWE
jgi:alpha-D-xyloside xylohydrolase